ncbi:hypothetical protein V3C99_016582 [Haemonchus contortus]
MISFFAEVLITAIAVPLCLVGLFGNISVLWATATDHQLHRKICYIVAVIASLHLICLLNELYLEAAQLRFHAVTRSECFRQTCLYIFAMVAQSVMFFMMAVDYLLAVSMPLKHHLLSSVPYVFYMCIPSFLLASFTVATSVFFMNDDPLDFCTPIQALPQNAEWLTSVVNVLNIGVLIVHLSVIALLGTSRRNRKALTPRGQQESADTRSLTSEDTKMMKSFTMLVTVFVCSWCFSTIITHIALKYLPSGLSLAVQTYTVILALPTYCQCYFVSYILSPRHRSAYRKQQRILFPCLFRTSERNDPT